jgi:hypothetical protein
MKSETVSRVFKAMMLAGGLLALTCPGGWAAGKAPTVLTFSETYADKVACTGDSSDGYDCEPYAVGKFTVKAVITTNDFGAAVDPSQFTGDTAFDITLGEYSYSGSLGGDPKYVAGVSKKATFQLSGDLCSASDINNGNDCPQKVYETITLSWTTKAVTVSISAETGADANGNDFESFIDADTFDGNGTGPVTGTISFEMDLGSLSVSSSIVPVAGTVATKDVTDKSGDDDTLSNVKLRGTLPVSDLGQ